MQRGTFESLGGFPDQPIMEDYELVRRLRRIGLVQVCDAQVATSGRRWRTLGPWRTTFVNQCIIAGYHLGVPVETLACWYGQRKRLNTALRGFESTDSSGTRETELQSLPS